MKTLRAQLLLDSIDHSLSLTQIRVNGKAFLTLSSKDISLVLENTMISSHLLRSVDYTVTVTDSTFEHNKLIHIIDINL